ncbi:DUF3301 domain-containing protein [Aliidiomarina taiwanensis]|uniref:DUF3301 domain-containing protein n=1 Tax=Aliidiomarina taiwanensis TaxID=946228 RepID=A0A432XAF4_9GAMM|nr:DUF3301 domain-containing protein [Aliidiomarina taiwanensis]RUO44367.1 DUF3301 domain-containing protein [Aliidiomarina taiwanensis]
MFNLYDVLVLFVFIGICAAFWQWRQQDETARTYAQHLCKKHELQLLDIARKSGRPSWQNGLGWLARYEFGFSSDREKRYEASLTLFNLRLQEHHIPPHRTPNEPAPQASATETYSSMSYGPSKKG